MLILGALSGIQDFVFALPEIEGGQARMLRARSFYVQVLTELLAVRVLHDLGLKRDALLFSAAGHFAIDAPAAASNMDHIVQTVSTIRRSAEEWLFARTGRHLRVAVGLEKLTGPDGATPAERYGRALADLRRAQLSPWQPLAAINGRWLSDRLVGALSDDGSGAELYEALGRALPSARWLLVEEKGAAIPGTAATSFEALDYRVFLTGEHAPPKSTAALLLTDLRRPGSPPPGLDFERWLSRPLARHVPLRYDGSPMWFQEIASHARGARLLGVLKMDADSLGEAVARCLRRAAHLRDLHRFSQALDGFFAEELDGVLRTAPWNSVYTVFSGGDDLLLVGPWDRMLDLAGLVQQRFQSRFQSERLTISGGLAFVKHRYPIRLAAEQADRLLERAKAELAPGAKHPKDQFACLGQLWKWRDHAAVLAAGKRLAEWVEVGAVQRGWLDTLLRLALLRRGDIRNAPRSDGHLATARLAAHVERNWPRRTHLDSRRRAAREWVERVLARFDGFDTSDDLDVRCLPAIVRYAMLATRTAGEERGS
ncbi:MAG: hypothetical protein HY704_14615 [Gemmatimonadetes bacterium]|nr:hypothetical protein [Gemmatimonadota bacterium]